MWLVGDGGHLWQKVLHGSIQLGNETERNIYGNVLRWSGEDGQILVLSSCRPTSIGLHRCVCMSLGVGPLGFKIWMMGVEIWFSLCLDDGTRGRCGQCKFIWKYATVRGLAFLVRVGTNLLNNIKNVVVQVIKGLGKVLGLLFSCVMHMSLGPGDEWFYGVGSWTNTRQAARALYADLSGAIRWIDSFIQWKKVQVG